jgi:hypothetical protein
MIHRGKKIEFWENMKTCIKMLNNKIKFEIYTSNDEQLKTISELRREIKRGRRYY